MRTIKLLLCFCIEEVLNRFLQLRRAEVMRLQK